MEPRGWLIHLPPTPLPPASRHPIKPKTLIFQTAKAGTTRANYLCVTSAHDANTRCVALPEELLRRCRGDESGVQLTDRQKRAAAPAVTKPATMPAVTIPAVMPTMADLMPTVTKPALPPEVEELGYDPFEDQPTLIHTASWRASVEPPTDFPLPLHQETLNWFDLLPDAARQVLMTAAEPVAVDAPRVTGAIAQPRKK